MKLILAGSVATSVWDLISQVPANGFLAVVLLVCILMLAVLFHGPACSRLIRIIKAISEVQRPKER